MGTEIRPIRLDETSLLQDFVRDEWNAEHAFVQSRTLLLWQHHRNPFKHLGGFSESELSFWGAWEGSRLIAVLGEIPIPFAIREQVVTGSWLAIWRNRAEGEHMTAGLQLLRKVISGPAAFVGGIGMNERVRGAYGLFRFQIEDDLPLYVVLNPDVESRWLRRKPTYDERRAAALFADTPAPAPSRKFELRPGAPDSAAWDGFWAKLRRNLVGTERNFEFMSWRYIAHSHFRYEWLRVYDAADALCAAAIYRVEEADGERTIHVLEFLGDGPPGERLAQALCAVMRERDASFLGFRCARVRSFEAWRTVGGGLYTKGDPTFELPSLFQPVVPEYKALAWVHRFDPAHRPADLAEFYVTRSDGDQDRPSLVAPDA